MRDYELMTIHRPDLAEDEVEAKIGELETYLSKSDSTVVKKDRWGKRRFAYEIDHISEGYYTVLTFQSDTDPVDGLDRMLSLSDDVIRHKIVKKDN
jgi:small subunit ribosomal protein S6